MALAIHFDGLIRDGVVKNYADLARLGGVSRARITQIMNLLNLSPEIQEQLLFESSSVAGIRAICERRIRDIQGLPLWQKQLGPRGVCARI
jgi:hypothetical protein